MAKVSVIVPVYNVKKYLPRCLESIMEQTLRDLEIICVDDGSTDGSGKMLEEYAARDGRIRVIHGRNAGYGAAMNAGLDAATGEYIGIVESDDCVQKEMFQVLYSHAVSDDLDLVKSDACYWIEDIGYKKRIHCQRLESYYGRVLHDVDRSIFFDFFMNIWTGIYKRDFLEKWGIRFHESPGASYQDNGFWMQTLMYCGSAKWIDRAFYLYRQDNPAASVKRSDRMVAMRDEYVFLEQILHDRGDEKWIPYCIYYRLVRNFGTFLRISDESKREFCGLAGEDYAAYKGYIKGNTFLDEWYRDISERPDEVCRNVIRKKKEVRERLETAPGIIIYGAGKQGDTVFRGIYNEGYYGKLKCFAVSMESGDERIGNKRILSIEDACRQFPGATVILAVVKGSCAYIQMAGKLKELGIRDYMDGSDIEQNFYIV